MSLYEFFKNKYKTQSYPIIDERQFDDLVAEIRAESSDRIKELEELVFVMKCREEFRNEAEAYVFHERLGG